MSKNDDGGNGGPDAPRTCVDLVFDTILNLAGEEASQGLQVGTTLEVRRRMEQGRSLAFCYWDQQQVGAVTGDRLAELLECIQKGSSYIGIVSAVDDGLVRVTIRPS